MSESGSEAFPPLDFAESESDTFPPLGMSESGSEAFLPLDFAESESEEELLCHQSSTKAQMKPTRVKRSSTEMPPGSPTKKRWKEAKEKTMDATARALKAIADGSEKKGLLKFFHKETKNEHQQRMMKESVEFDLQRQRIAKDAILKAEREAAAKEKVRLEAKKRKRKSRGKIYDRERANGLRDNNMRLKRRKVS